jgi:hypothetical protein
MQMPRLQLSENPQEAGYTLLGNFGDQWSDLVGEFNAQANFKLPNPMYYLL